MEKYEKYISKNINKKKFMIIVIKNVLKLNLKKMIIMNVFLN